MQVRIDSELVKLAKIEATKSGMTIKALLEECLGERLSPLNTNKPFKTEWIN